MEKLLQLPVLASEHGQRVNNLMVYIHWLMAALFVGWLMFFLYTLWRFRQQRNRRGDYLGVRNHASSYLEVLVAGIEGVLLVFVAVPVWARQVDKFPKESESTVIQVVAQQFAWNARYPGLDDVFGKQDMRLVNSTNTFGVDPADAKGQDDVQVLNEMHVPVNKPVIAYISSKDVIHSFKLLAMRVTQDAIPGHARADLVQAGERGQVPDPVRAVVRQRPCQHGGRDAGGRKPGRLRQMARLQDRRRYQFRVAKGRRQPCPVSYGKPAAPSPRQTCGCHGASALQVCGYEGASRGFPVE